MSKATVYMWLKTIVTSLFPGAFVYGFYLLGVLTPRPGFEGVFEIFFFGIFLAFLMSIVITLVALVYNAYRATNLQNSEKGKV